MNNSEISGYLGADPVVRHTQGGKTVANGRLANTEKWKDASGNQKEETTWVDFDAWGGWADSVGQFKKGDHVVVYGKLKLDEWTDKDSGQKRSKLKISAQEVYKTVRTNKGGDDSGPPEESSAPQGRQAPPQRQAPAQRQAAPQSAEMFTADL